MSIYERRIHKSVYDIQQRKDRAVKQRMFLISAEYEETNQWMFVVEGSTGMNYDVVINKDGMKCSCFDCKSRNRVCKHIYFIIYRIAQNEDLFKKLDADLSTNMFVDGDALTTSLKSRLESRLQSESKKEDNDTKDPPPKTFEDPCCICFDHIEQGDEEEECHTCKKAFHEACIRVWRRRNPTCPLCRSTWKRKFYDVEENVDEMSKFRR